MKTPQNNQEELQLGLRSYEKNANVSEIYRDDEIDSMAIPDFDDPELPFGNDSSTDGAIEDEVSCDYEEPCVYNCPTVDDFLSLTDELIETILGLEEELVRWRQALIKYLPKEWAEGLRQDIFNNLSRDFEGDPAYDLYVNLHQGMDPQQSEERRARLYRLAEGIDDTSITYL